MRADVIRLGTFEVILTGTEGITEPNAFALTTIGIIAWLLCISKAVSVYAGISSCGQCSSMLTMTAAAQVDYNQARQIIGRFKALETRRKTCDAANPQDVIFGLSAQRYVTEAHLVMNLLLDQTLRPSLHFIGRKRALGRTANRSPRRDGPAERGGPRRAIVSQYEEQQIAASRAGGLGCVARSAMPRCLARSMSATCAGQTTGTDRTGRR